MMPICHCGASSKLADNPQTMEQYKRGVDNYICKNGHIFEAKIPFEMQDGFSVRADM